ncbi:hypothetical protein [Gelidibacter sp. F63206]|uniref:hypothetical protein n=1 Tax=Gelidibacter sp. F63206 TaxID=2926425 RepID=UPI001FF3B029|nr:hypothetical protein [Gelidibacter sp. F63206]MCK0114783.1 hypothetical protein [Gelidibacter sp. F63206]
MSMTMTAFIDKARIPTKLEIETQIKTLGYNFRFNENFNLFDEFGGDCELDGQDTFFEIYFIKKEEVISEMPSLNKDLDNFDSAFSFIWGADSIAGACISIISVALIDLCNSKVVLEDFEVWYDREMLMEEIPMFIEEENTNIDQAIKEKLTFDKRQKSEKITNIILWSLLITTVLLMNRNIISWYIPSFLLVAVLIKSVIDHNKKRKFKH